MITPSAHLRSVVDRDGAVILDIEHDAISTLNVTGAYVWERLQEGKSSDEIVEGLARETGVEVSVVDRDVHAFFEELKLKGLLPR
jgi:Coenzyme PQQ synthesis protein D (PqqD)